MGASGFIANDDLVTVKSALARDNQAPELIELFPRVAELEDLYVPSIYGSAIPRVICSANVYGRDQRSFLHRLCPLRSLLDLHGHRHRFRRSNDPAGTPGGGRGRFTG